MQKTNIFYKEGEQEKRVHMQKGSEGRRAAPETGRTLLYTDNFRRSITTREYKPGMERNCEEIILWKTSHRTHGYHKA